MQVKVSIIVPVKDRCLELIRAIRSVLNQRYVYWELLVVDDYSEEDISGVVDSFKDNRLRYIRSTGTPGNANVCRNIGFKEAKGEFIAMLDSDDEWLVNHLDDRINIISSLGVDGLFGSVLVFDGVTKREVISRPFKENEGMADYLFSNGSAPTPSHFYRVKAAQDILWDENLLRHQDYDFSIRFAEKYQFVPCNVCSVIVHWEVGVPRLKHVPSMIYFVNKHWDRLNPVVMKKYLLARFSEFWQQGERDSAKLFRREALKLGNELTLTDYHQLYPFRNLVGKLMVRLKFVLFKRFAQK